MRIAKYLSHAGVCSRREAERMISEGRIKVDNKIIDHPSIKVDGNLKIEVDNKLIQKPLAPKLWMYNKPKGLIVTQNDNLNRETIFENLPKSVGYIIAVGRLDINSEGLLLMTNNGELSNFLESPNNGWKRVYLVRVFGKINKEKLDSLAKGISIDRIIYQPIKVKIIKESTNSWLEITLTEGKNREIRKILEHFNLKISRLIRTSYGPFKLKYLQKNQLAEIPTQTLKHSIKNFPGI